MGSRRGRWPRRTDVVPGCGCEGRGRRVEMPGSWRGWPPGCPPPVGAVRGEALSWWRSLRDRADPRGGDRVIRGAGAVGEPFDQWRTDRCRDEPHHGQVVDADHDDGGPQRDVGPALTA